MCSYVEGNFFECETDGGNDWPFIRQWRIFYLKNMNKTFDLVGPV